MGLLAVLAGRNACDSFEVFTEEGLAVETHRLGNLFYGAVRRAQQSLALGNDEVVNHLKCRLACSFLDRLGEIL